MPILTKTMMSFSKRGEKGLSHRLRTLANFYHQSPVIYDIGCDHGLLGLSFCEREEVREIHFVDPSGPVIESLNVNLIDSHISRKDLILETHQITGQKLQLSPLSKCIFIAGMGGKEIGEILLKLTPQLSSIDRVVISPHRKILELRRSLQDSPFGLVTELVMREENQFYLIMVLEKRRDLPRISRYGTYLWQTPDGKEYLNKEVNHFGLHQDDLSKGYIEYLQSVLAGFSD
jgi:tRNA A22 N-methylase